MSKLWTQSDRRDHEPRERANSIPEQEQDAMSCGDSFEEWHHGQKCPLGEKNGYKALDDEK